MALTFFQTSGFVQDCRRLRITDDDLRQLEAMLLENAEAGDVMRGTGGLRKVRFSPARWNRGKSGGTRVCYVFFRTHDRVYFVTLFGKNEQSNLSAAEKLAARRIIEAITDELKGVKP